MYEEAAALMRRALEGYESTLGSEHSGTADVVNRLGNLCTKQSKDKEADALLLRMENKELGQAQS